MNMERKTVGIIATVATTLLCACPGLFLCLFGGLSAAGQGTFTSQVMGNSGAGKVAPGVGIALLCVGILLVAIPIVVGFFTLRKKPEAANVGQVPPAA
jgi:hypothetical protein